MESEKCAVVELYQTGKSATEILKGLNYSQSRRNFVYRTIQRYNETGSDKDRKRSGRPKSATTSSVKKKIAARISRNPQRSMRKMAEELQISRESVRRMVKRDLGLSPLRLRKIHLLTTASRQKRLDGRRLLIQRLEGHGLDTVLFSDEKIFSVEQCFNRQNDRVLSKNVSSISEELRNVRRTQNPASVMV